jgi:anti-sigma regulatory factor (Ser/Thr protein kinase)
MIAMAPPRPSQHGPSPRSEALPSQVLAPAGPLPPSWPHDSRLPLRPGAAAASQARDHLRMVVSVWGVGVDVDVLVLLASELVTNAVTHAQDGSGAAGGRISLCVRARAGELRVEVHDGSPVMPLPVPPDADDEAETGRGLMLVDALAAEWGFYRTPGGKAAYFTLPFLTG